MDEVLAILQSWDAGEDHYSAGATRDGQSLDLVHLDPGFARLPPAAAIAHCTLTVYSDDGDRVLEVALGRGGIVIGKRLAPGYWQYRVDKVRATLTRAKSDLCSALWWRDQLRKLHRSLRRRPERALGVALGLVFASAWTVVRYRGMRRANRTPRA